MSALQASAVPGERWVCSCGEDVTPRLPMDEGWLFHWMAGHRIDVIEMQFTDRRELC